MVGAMVVCVEVSPIRVGVEVIGIFVVAVVVEDNMPCVSTWGFLLVEVYGGGDRVLPTSVECLSEFPNVGGLEFSRRVGAWGCCNQ